MTDAEACDQLASQGMLLLARNSSMGSTALKLGVGKEMSQFPLGVAVELWFSVLWHEHMSPSFFGEATDKFKQVVRHAQANPRELVVMLGVAQLERPYMHLSSIYNPLMSQEQFKTAMTAEISRLTALERSCENS